MDSARFQRSYLSILILWSLSLNQVEKRPGHNIFDLFKHVQALVLVVPEGAVVNNLLPRAYLRLEEDQVSLVVFDSHRRVRVHCTAIEVDAVCLGELFQLRVERLLMRLIVEKLASRLALLTATSFAKHRLA